MEGTPLETRSWALYRDGLEPLGCEGLLVTFFLKLEAIAFIFKFFKGPRGCRFIRTVTSRRLYVCLAASRKSGQAVAYNNYFEVKKYQVFIMAGLPRRIIKVGLCGRIQSRKYVTGLL